MSLEDIPLMAKEGKNFFRYMGFHKGFEYNEDHVSDILKKSVDSKNMKVLVYERNGELTAFMGGLVQAPFYNMDHPVLMEFIWWTSDRGRGNGDGIRVLKRLEEWAKSVGAKSSVIEVIEGELAAPTENMLSRMGYAPIERRYMKGLVN